VESISDDLQQSRRRIPTGLTKLAGESRADSEEVRGTHIFRAYYIIVVKMPSVWIDTNGRAAEQSNGLPTILWQSRRHMREKEITV
jgi:hypothetical protein